MGNGVTSRPLTGARQAGVYQCDWCQVFAFTWRRSLDCDVGTCSNCGRTDVMDDYEAEEDDGG